MECCVRTYSRYGVLLIRLYDANEICGNDTGLSYEDTIHVSALSGLSLAVWLGCSGRSKAIV